MSIEQLMGRYLRLKQDLEIAYNAQPWHSGRINRLTDDIARTERELAERSISSQTMQGTLRPGPAGANWNAGAQDR